MRLKNIVGAVCGAMALNYCGGPSVQPTPVTQDPVVNCPSDVSVTAHNGQTPTVSFDTPVAVNGTPPVTVVCTPASGTPFKNGITSVTCEATDSRAHKASCSFSVVVTAVPQLVKTTFLAFGDSLTEGKTTLIGPGAVEVPSGIVLFSTSYVELLYSKLTDRYQDQSIRIIAEGVGGQITGEDKFRLADVLTQYKPDVLLLLEGTNDMLNFPNQGGIDSAAGALQRMVQDAKARGARVFLATLPQMIPTGFRTSPDSAAAVPVLNARIRNIAALENVTLVDIYSAVPSAFVGRDGVHLTADGYAVMADEWLKAIIATMEVKTSTLQ